MMETRDKMIVGARQTRKALHKQIAAEVFLALDADVMITGPIREQCVSGSVPVTEITTMAELGRFCNIDRGASVACRVNED